MLKTLSVLILLGIQIPVILRIDPPSLSAVYDSRSHSVKIRWQNESRDIKAFVIQRSADNKTWTDIALRQVNNSAGTMTYSFEDSKPKTGENHYRLKYITKEDKAEYTAEVMVIIGSAGYDWVMYPVPVRDMLTLQYRGSAVIRGVITVLIQNASGNIITRVRNSSLTRIIQVPVSNLGSGVYDVRIIVEDEIIWSQRFIK